MKQEGNQPQLKILPLGGSGMVTKNLFVYEYGNDIVIVDCGMGFPESEQLGVDIVIPDISYLRDKLNRIRGIVITHGHEDHYGSLPYLLPELGFPPVYVAKLVRGLAQVKLEEHGLLKQARLIQFEPNSPFSLGNFTFHPFRVNHSIPDAFGYFIQTPIGNVVHASDFKFDWSPVDGKVFEVSKLATLVKQGVVCLLSDCLGSTSEGYTKSERFIQRAFEEEVEKASGQVFITTVSSNISRIQQAVNVAVKFGRKVAFLGMSVAKNTEVAQNLGYLNISKGLVVEPGEINKYPDNKLMIIIAGSYGQPRSSLVRLADGGHRQVQLKKDSVVIFSADPIPGVFDQVGAVIDKLVLHGARVVYSEIQENLHVSGHGAQGDLSMMASIVHPSHFIPIGGSPRHMRAYTELMSQLGFDRRRVLELREGEGVILTPDSVHKKKMVTLNNIFVDGSRVGDVGEVVLRDRQKLSEDGIFIVILKKGKEGVFHNLVHVISRGFVYMAISDELINEAKGLVLSEIRGKKVSGWAKLRGRIDKRLSDFLYRKTERRPMVLTILIG
ncbi:ribonuclease J [Patescibacteria group bacterium]|nr:ribonuclease J [Patescibacteria group bacterium]MBU1868601.1 ribonuclease J [Patescibacteria group bacterium]